MTILIYLLLIVITTAASTVGLWVAGKLTACEGPLLGYAVASFLSIAIGFVIPIPFIGFVSNLFLLKYVTGQSIYPHVLLLVVVATFVQYAVLFILGGLLV